MKGRFRSIALDREDAVAVKLDYIHNNPVRRGLVDEPEDWRWSSYGSYYGGEFEFGVEVALGCVELMNNYGGRLGQMSRSRSIG